MTLIRSLLDDGNAGFNFENSCVAATTANLTATYSNGASGVGATLTNSGALAAFSVDGQTPSIGARILVKDQSTQTQNGIYVVTVAGSGSVAWVLTRADNYDTPSQINSGDIVPVSSGTQNAGSLWRQTATVTTVGSSNITFAGFFLPSNYVLKEGDTMTGTLAMSGAAINEAAYVTVASAATCDIGAAASNNVAISGTTTITSFGTAAAGVTRRCRATGAFLITYNATSLITANGKNITTKADDCFTMTSLGSGNWIMTAFKPADGRILANAINNQTGTSYTVALTDIGNDITLSNASAITTTLPAANTFPIGAKIKVINLGVGVNTFVKTGTDILIGNTTLIQYGVAELEVLSSNTWQISYATATIVEQASVCIDGTLTNDKVYDVFSAPDNVTIIGFSLRNTSAGTAGTYTARINGTNITGLVGIANTTTRTNTAPTAANTMTYQQVLQYVPTGMTSVVDAFITVFYTRQY